MTQNTKRTRRAGDASVAVGYIRVSTDKQDLGPDAQRAALAAWCASNGATLVEVHEDRGVSGGAPLDRRPGLLAALASVGIRKAGVLLVAKRDRLARDVVIATTVERAAVRAGAQVIAADGVGNGDSPADQFLRTIIDGAAQYERALIRARTRAALAVKRERGESTGGSAPYGHRLASDGVHVEPHPDEQATLAKVRALRAEGYSMGKIAARLTADGIPPRGSRWHKTTVARLLAR